MPAFNVKLKNKQEVAQGTMAFYFEKPAGFEYKASQHINVTLVDPSETDDEGNTRVFSLASAPYEKELMIATRIRDTAFKKIIKNIVPGAEVEIYGPAGNFILHSDVSSPTVFLAGGIGITPLYSMIKQAFHDKLSHRIYLFYSNRRPEDAAFLDELLQMEKDHKKFTFIGTMTEMESSKLSWSGETGYIDLGMIKKYINNVKSSVYYIAGPPPMTAAMQEMLNNVGVNKNNVHHESFFGY